MTEDAGGIPEPRQAAEDGSDGHDDEFAIVFDEAFVRAAPVKEPSARTRLLEARWREAPPEPQGWRAEEPEPNVLHLPTRGSVPGRRRRGLRRFFDRTLAWQVAAAIAGAIVTAGILIATR